MELCSGKCEVQVRKFQKNDDTVVKKSDKKCPDLDSEELSRLLRRQHFQDTVITKCGDDKHCRCNYSEPTEEEWNKKDWIKLELSTAKEVKKIVDASTWTDSGRAMECTWTISGWINMKSLIVTGTCDPAPGSKIGK